MRCLPTLLRPNLAVLPPLLALLFATVCRSLRATLCTLLLASSATAALAAVGPAATQELHHRLDTTAPAHARDVALTLDACSGAFDRSAISTLVRLRVPATLFVTRRWLAANPDAVRELLAHPDLFELQNHGAAHVPAVVGRSVFGLKGPADVAGVEREVAGGADAVARASGRAPGWFRGAGAAYDAAGQQAIHRQGERIAGFSVNADGGATLPAAAVAQRLRQLRPGDIAIAHMNKPHSGTAAGLATALPELLGRGLHFVTLSKAAGLVPAPDPARQPASQRASQPAGQPVRLPAHQAPAPR